MMRNYDENGLLESSGLVLLFNLILSVFYTTLVIEFVLRHRFSAILLL